MDRRRSLLPSRVELVIVALLCAGVSSCLWSVLRDARGPTGDPIPKQPPDEANRVHSPLGFSMVVPPDWNARITGSLFMAPMSPGRYARRSKALIDVSYLGHETPSEVALSRKTRFLGEAAYEGMEVVRPWTFDDGAWSEYTLYARRGADWYEIRYGIAEERTTLPAMVRRYLNTLRLDEPHPGSPSPPATAGRRPP
jgi:hypothetical protein